MWEPSGIVRSSVGCKDQPCILVSRKGRDREEKKEDILAKEHRKELYASY